MWSKTAEQPVSPHPIKYPPHPQPSDSFAAMLWHRKNNKVKLSCKSGVMSSRYEISGMSGKRVCTWND